MITDRDFLRAEADYLRTPAPVRVCPRCHGDCYIAVGDGERRCPSCRGTGAVADAVIRSVFAAR